MPDSSVAIIERVVDVMRRSDLALLEAGELQTADAEWDALYADAQSFLHQRKLMKGA